MTKILNLFLLFVLTSAILLTGCGNKEKTVIKSVEDLEHAIIGVQIGTISDIYITDLIKDKPNASIIRFNSNPEAVEAVLQDKIDCLLIDSEPAKEFAKKHGNLKILDTPFAKDNYAAIIAKENQSLLLEVNKAIDSLKQDGTLKKIIDSYTNGGSEKFHYTQKTLEGPKLIVATNADFPPYEYHENNQIIGIDIEIAKAIADKLNRVLKIEDMDFDSIINAVISGKADIGLSGFSITEERKKSVNFSSEYVENTQVIVVRNYEQFASNQSFFDKIHTNLIKNNNYQYILEGLGATLVITFFACIIGVIGGVLIAIIRVSYFFNGSFKILNFLCEIYLTIIRGTPVLVQLLIIYFVIFATVDINKIFVASIAFGLNSAAYVAEIARAGLMSIDRGQFEAGIALGLKFRTVMCAILIPQAFKNILPALANEFICLIKETSIAGYIGITDLTRGGMIIRSITYDAMIPLLTVAFIYLVIVMILTKLVKILEKRLKKNER